MFQPLTVSLVLPAAACPSTAPDLVVASKPLLISSIYFVLMTVPHITYAATNSIVAMGNGTTKL